MVPEGLNAQSRERPGDGVPRRVYSHAQPQLGISAHTHPTSNFKRLSTAPDPHTAPAHTGHVVQGIPSSC